MPMTLEEMYVKREELEKRANVVMNDSKHWEYIDLKNVDLALHDEIVELDLAIDERKESYKIRRK